jgi:hypothetical protein
MRTLRFAAAALIAGLSATTLVARAELDVPTLERVYNQTYHDLSTEEHSCAVLPCPAISSDKVQQIFDNNYTAMVGQEPTLNDYLQWKYNTDFPNTISSDLRFPQTATMIREGRAAVRNIPENEMVTNKVQTIEIVRTSIK